MTVAAAEISEAFADARARGVKRPRLRLDSFVFVAIQGGAIRVTEDGERRGEITHGKFWRSRECDDATFERIIAACADPKAGAIAYGQSFGACSICGRELTNAASIEAAIGPKCAAKYGWGEG